MVDMMVEDLRATLLSLVKMEDWKTLKQEIEDLEPFQISEVFEGGDATVRDKIIIFRLLNKQQTKDVFKLLSHDQQQEIIEGLAENANKIAQILNDIDPDDRTAFLEELPAEVSRELIRQLSPEQRAITNQLLGYPKESIGRLMTTQYVAIKPHYTVERAFQHIRKYGVDSETLNIIYIVDKDGRLIDDIRIRDLIFAESDKLVGDLVNNQFVSLNAYDDQEKAISVFKDYSMVALPVIDQDGVLLGIVTFDDIMDVADDESSEDFHKFSAMQSSIGNPLKARVIDLYKNRVLWLVALVFMNVFSGAALASYENVIQHVVALIFFFPLLINSGGNAGSQTATLMVRSIAMGDVKPSDWFKLIGKELVVSLLLGITMALGVTIIANFRAPETVIVVSLAMIIIVIWSSLVGLLLPFIFTKLKFDPATASAPLITTIADISGVIIYFGLASWYFADEIQEVATQLPM
ncbi:MAG: magnesium transporter [Brumimicrobium sp.]